MPKNKRKFLCNGCRGNDTEGPVVKGMFVMCTYADTKVPPVEYQKGAHFESCKYRRGVKLQKLAKIARDKGTCDPASLVAIEQELGIPLVN